MAGIKDVAKQAGLKEEQIKQVFEAVEGIVLHERVTIKGFGTFQIKTRHARIGRNPKTGEEIKIPAKEVMTFKPSK